MSVDERRLRWAVNGARTVVIPTDAVPAALAELDRAMHDAHFRADASHAPEMAHRVYRRGSVVGDVLIGGSGLSAITSRLGPLSAKGIVVVSVEERPDASARVIASLVAGSHVGGDFVDAVEDAVRVLASRELLIEDAGWTRAVDVDPTSPANPRRAAELGIH